MLGETEQPITDGFTLSTSQLYLPTTFRSSALAQMDILRRANSFRHKDYCVPDNLQATIPAFSQLEYQVVSFPGAYLWGLMFSVLTTGNLGTISVANAPSFIHIQITDACTETALFSDYCYGQSFVPSTGVATGGAVRNPVMMAQPMLLGQPAHLNVELYNRGSVSITCQLVLSLAEPMLSVAEMQQLLKEEGLV